MPFKCVADVATMYVNQAGAGKYLGVSERSLLEWRRRRSGPPYVRLGGTRTGRVRYDLRELDRWMRDQTADEALDGSGAK